MTETNQSSTEVLPDNTTQTPDYKALFEAAEARAKALESESTAAKAAATKAVEAMRETSRSAALSDVIDSDVLSLPVFQSALEYDDMGRLTSKALGAIAELRKGKPHFFKPTQQSGIMQAPNIPVTRERAGFDVEEWKKLPDKQKYSAEVLMKLSESMKKH
jgi:hypothetical protein